MISDIVQNKKSILQKISKAGIPSSNLSAVLLYGSHIWGYDTPKSDIDLFIILKTEQEKVHDIENISLHYQITPEQLSKKVLKGSWASFLCVKHASYLIFGKRPKVPDYQKAKILNYLDKNKELEIDVLLDHARAWCFQTLMKRVYFLNYFFNNNPTFKITDFQHCKQLTQEERDFIERQYVKIFEHEEDDNDDKVRLKELILNVEEIIRERSK